MKLFISAALLALVSAKCKKGVSYEVFGDDKCTQSMHIKFVGNDGEIEHTGICDNAGAGSQYTDCSPEAFFTHTFGKPSCQGIEVSYIEYPYGKCVKLPDGKFAKVDLPK